MIIERRIRKDLNLKLPKPIIKKLHLKRGTRLWIEKIDSGLRLTPFSRSEIKEYKRKKRKHLS